MFVKKGIATRATVVEGCFDPDADWVLLRLDHDVDILPAPLGTLGRGEIGEKVAARTFGFPAENSKVGRSYHGYVADADTTYAGTAKGPRKPAEAAAIQLFVESAKDNDIAGLSGGPCFVGGALVGVIRSTLTDQDELSKGHLYACPIASILDTIGERLPLLDPYRGLPGLPQRALPGRFFRYLERYTEADAEIFFGRGRELHELYRFLLSEDAPPIVLFFGQTGVGKSSVLDAGLTPRLRLHREPLYVRRDAAQGLVHSLTTALAGALGTAVSAGATAPALLWREVEKALGKPLIVVLDQVEEAYTRSNERTGPLPDSLAPGQDPGDVELSELDAHLATVFGDAAARPRGRLVLSFRKEWLAEISARLEDRGLSFSRILLERLDEDGIQEIVLGLQRTPRSQAKWRASVDPDLPLIVSNGLLSDPGSPVAPTLQIIMTRMFEAADQKSPGAPALTVEVYNALKGRAEALASVEQLLVRAEKATSPLEALPLLCRAVELLPADDPRLDSLVARTIQVAVDAPIVSADLLASGELAGHATAVRRILATDLSADGREALAQLADGAIWIIPVDAAAVLSGRVLGPAQTLDLEGKHFNAPRLSPDGKWVSAMEQGSDQLAIWEAGSPSGPRMLAMAHGDSTRRA